MINLSKNSHFFTILKHIFYMQILFVYISNIKFFTRNSFLLLFLLYKQRFLCKLGPKRDFFNSALFIISNNFLDKKTILAQILSYMEHNTLFTAPPILGVLDVRWGVLTRFAAPSLLNPPRSFEIHSSNRQTFQGIRG